MSYQRVSRADLVFHTIEPVLIRDSVTGQQLRLDGAWKTKSGRTLYYALSAPGSILRQPHDLEIPQGVQ